MTVLIRGFGIHGNMYFNLPHYVFYALVSVNPFLIL